MAERYSWAVSDTGGLISSEDARIHLGSLLQPGGVLVTDVRSGWLPLGPGTNAPGQVTANGSPNNSVNIAPFIRVQQSVRGRGPYIMVNDASDSINILSTPAHATNPRNDLIVAQQSDKFYGDADSNMVIRHIVGTPAASPADPVVSGSQDYVLLARVRVSANASAITGGMIDDLRPGLLTTAVGGMLPIASAAERTAITAPYQGMAIYRTDRNWREVYTGSAWRVLDTVVVGAFADLATHVTNPFHGQLAIVTGDSAIALYNGSAWVYQMFYANTLSYARYRHTSTQSISNATDTRMRFQTAVDTSPDVTPSGTGNDIFTLNRSGRWRIDLGMRWAAQGAGLGNERHAFIANSDNMPGHRYGGMAIQVPNAVPVSLAATCTKRFASGAKIAAVLFQNSTGSCSTATDFTEASAISFTWEGP